MKCINDVFFPSKPYRIVNYLFHINNNNIDKIGNKGNNNLLYFYIYIYNIIKLMII